MHYHFNKWNNPNILKMLYAVCTLYISPYIFVYFNAELKSDLYCLCLCTWMCVHNNPLHSIIFAKFTMLVYRTSTETHTYTYVKHWGRLMITVRSYKSTAYTFARLQNWHKFISKSIERIHRTNDLYECKNSLRISYSVVYNFYVVYWLYISCWRYSKLNTDFNRSIRSYNRNSNTNLNPNSKKSNAWVCFPL